MKFWSKIFSNLTSRKTKPVPPSAQTAAKSSEPYLTASTVFGTGDSSVCFVDETRGIQKTLIDPDGTIQNFPGVVKNPLLIKAVPAASLLPTIKYRTSFEKRSGGWIMFWEVQPDGAYWADESGFGAEKDEEVTLYTYVDENGDFTGPFRLYKIGSRCYSPSERLSYAHSSRYKAELERLKNGQADDDLAILFPRMQGMDLSRGMHTFDDYYSLWNRADVVSCWEHPLLRTHLLESTEVLLTLEPPIGQHIPYPHSKGVHSCITSFLIVSGEPIFQSVLDKFYGGEPEPFTVKMLVR